MKKWILSAIGVAVLLSSAGEYAFAARNAPLTPELAAKRENYRKQHAQRITHEKRKAAVDALKAERLKVYQAKQAARQAAPAATESK